MSQSEKPLFNYATIAYGQPVRVTMPGHSYVACVRKVHRKGDKADGPVTGFLVHGSDFDAYGRCRLTPWVTAAPELRR